jgi:G3E family GTPase
VSELAAEEKYDYLIIESTGISEPLPVAQTFSFTDKNGDSMSKVARLDTCVTVVDATEFWEQWNSKDSLKDRGEQAHEKDERSICDLLVDQIQFANVVILNKVDLIKKDNLKSICGVISKLNSAAKIIESVHCAVPLENVFNTELFDMEKASASEAWIRELQAGHHNPETLEYGVSSFVYKPTRPFHPGRLNELLLQLRLRSSTLWKSVIRSKGHIWLATRPDHAGTWSHTGKQVNLTGGTAFWAAIPRAQWPESCSEIFDLMQDWNQYYGDRSTTLVIIGVNMDQNAVESAFDDALVDPDDMKDGQFPEKWDELEDPFPAWEADPRLTGDHVADVQEHKHH